MQQSRIWYCGTCNHVWRDNKVPSDNEVFSPRTCPNCGSHAYGPYEGVTDITDVKDSVSPYHFRLKEEFLGRELVLKGDKTQ